MSFLCCCFAAEPPKDGVKAKGNAGQKYGALVALQDRPNEFQTNLCDAPCANPLCCCVTGCFPCCLAGKHRQDALDTLGNGIQDYACCQGYIPKCCCCDFPNMCKGSACGLWCESCCCDTLSLSFTRIYVMDKKDLHPDPVDYQIIQFSNCMQLLACFCHILAMIEGSFRQLAQIVDLIAEIVERIVSGCMGAQIQLELAHTKSGGPPKVGAGPTVVQATAVHYGAPALAITDVDAEKSSVEVANVISRE